MQRVVAPAPSAAAPMDNVTVTLTPLARLPLLTLRCESRSRLAPTSTDPVRVLTHTRRPLFVVMAAKPEKLDPVWDDLDRCADAAFVPRISSHGRLVANRPAMQDHGAHVNRQRQCVELTARRKGPTVHDGLRWNIHHAAHQDAHREAPPGFDIADGKESQMYERVSHTATGLLTVRSRRRDYQAVL